MELYVHPVDIAQREPCNLNNALKGSSICSREVSHRMIADLAGQVTTAEVPVCQSQLESAGKVFIVRKELYCLAIKVSLATTLL